MLPTDEIIRNEMISKIYVLNIDKYWFVSFKLILVPKIPVILSA